MDIRTRLLQGGVIPAHPLALNSQRKLDERRQRALTRYYIAAGAAGIAVGVHTTQFQIRKVGLLKPVLELAIEENARDRVIAIGGVCGPSRQAAREAELASALGYDAVLLSLGALADASVDDLIQHAEAIAGIIPVVGFYLQPAVGGRILPYDFWRRFAEIENVVAIKIAPFNRYQTLDVVRALIDSGRATDIALYTGNDDNIVVDLLTDFNFGNGSARIVGGLLGHWAVWTCSAVSIWRCIAETRSLTPERLTVAQQITDMNAAIFDPSHNFRGCIPGIHQVLRRQGLLEGRYCLDPHEELSPGQNEEIDRVRAAYPHLAQQDDAFIKEHLDTWLR
ncbi:MAG: dihydrodipicolinate synthase family protein [Acidobacteriaceae bacterium]|nr:dihydrodipicolinate synthase family protein [Acidobacteriaceae bacterium]